MTLIEALASDDFREQYQGMPADDRLTCWSHQCWADEAHLSTHNY